MATEGAPQLLGQRLGDERYQVGEIIGGGGHAWVYQATDVRLGRKVALKILKPSAGGHYPPQMGERFALEARMTARLESPYTVTLHDFGEHVSELGSYLFMAFEYVDGVTLSQHLREHGKLSPLQLATVLRQILLSLQEAHGLGFVHRDIKSPNIMLYTDKTGRDFQVKVLDYGIGKATEIGSEWDYKITDTGMIHGTPAYAAPEQLTEGQIGPHTDLYAVGMVAFEALLGAHPYVGMSLQKMIVSILNEPSLRVPASMRSSPLADFVDHLLQKDIEKRPASCKEALKELERLELRSGQSSEEEAATPVLWQDEGDDAWFPPVEAQEPASLALADTEESKPVALPQALAETLSDAGPTAQMSKHQIVQVRMMDSQPGLPAAKAGSTAPLPSVPSESSSIDSTPPPPPAVLPPPKPSPPLEPLSNKDSLPQSKEGLEQSTPAQQQEATPGMPPALKIVGAMAFVVLLLGLAALLTDGFGLKPKANAAPASVDAKARPAAKESEPQTKEEKKEEASARKLEPKPAEPKPQEQPKTGQAKASGTKEPREVIAKAPSKASQEKPKSQKAQDKADDKEPVSAPAEDAKEKAAKADAPKPEQEKQDKEKSDPGLSDGKEDKAKKKYWGID